MIRWLRHWWFCITYPYRHRVKISDAWVATECAHIWANRNGGQFPDPFKIQFDQVRYMSVSSKRIGKAPGITLVWPRGAEYTPSSSIMYVEDICRRVVDKWMRERGMLSAHSTARGE